MEKKLTDNNSMYEGPILPLIFKLAIPIYAGGLFQILYNLTDLAWVARINPDDPSYMGGIGLIFPLIFFAIALSNGIVVGTSSLVARAIGEKNYKVLDKTAESALFISIIISIIITAACYLFDDQIVSFLGANNNDNLNLDSASKSDYLVHALEYLRFIVPTGIFLFSSSVFYGILQGEGKMKKVMIAMIIGTIANIILDPIFIFGFKLEVKGAALATSISQLISFIYIISIFITNKTNFKIHWKLKNISLKIIKNIFIVGFPQSLHQILLSVSILIFNWILIKTNQLTMTAFVLYGRFELIIIYPIIAISTAAMTITGQNAGKGLVKRIRKTWDISIASGMITTFFFALLIVIISPLIYPFFNRDPEVLKYVKIITYCFSFTLIFPSIGIISRSVFLGIGKPLPSIIFTVLRLYIFAIPLVLINVFVFKLGFIGFISGIIIANLISAIITFISTKILLGELVKGKIKILKTEI